MGFYWIAFDRYTTHYIGGKSLQSGEPGADINCYNGNDLVGLIRFFSDNVAIPDNQRSNGQINLYYEISRFNDIATLLRYEKPLYLTINTTTKFGYVGCGQLEPVGEQEGV